MLDSVRNNQTFAFVQLDDLFTKFDSHSAAPDKKEFILLFVMMPGKNALKFYQLHFLAIQFADNLRPPMFAKGFELFREIDLFHRTKPSCSRGR